jgi:hypothetical protein
MVCSSCGGDREVESGPQGKYFIVYLEFKLDLYEH